MVSKEVLRQLTDDCRGWIEAYARNHGIAMEWAEKNVRKEDHVLPALRRMEKKDADGVYFIFKSMRQGRTFRIGVPKYPTADPNYRIMAHQHSRFTHYYFYIRDEILGPIVLRVASFFPLTSSSNATFPIHKIFERSCEIGLWRLTANRIGEIFGVQRNKRLRGPLANSRFHHRPDPAS